MPHHLYCQLKIPYGVTKMMLSYPLTLSVVPLPLMLHYETNIETLLVLIKVSFFRYHEKQIPHTYCLKLNDDVRSN